MLREVGGEGATAGNPVDQPLGDEVLERLPHRVPADAVPPAKLGLRRHPAPLPELAALEGVPQLAVQPPVRRRPPPLLGPRTLGHITHHVTIRARIAPHPRAPAPRLDPR